jgi:hypothetical protein
MPGATITMPLADEIAAHLERAGPTAATELVRVLRRRRGSVFRVLRDDPRFEQTGGGRGSRWRLASQEPHEGTREPMGTIPSADEGTDMGSTVAAAEGFLSACTDPVGHAGFHAVYTDFNGDRRCIRCDPQPVVPPLTFREWLRGEGGEDRRQEFEANLYLAQQGTATREQRERFALAVREVD